MGRQVKIWYTSCMTKIVVYHFLYLRGLLLCLLLLYMGGKDLFYRKIDYLPPVCLMLLKPCAGIWGLLRGLIWAAAIFFFLELICFMLNDLSGLGGGDVRLLMSMAYFFGDDRILYVMLWGFSLFLLFVTFLCLWKRKMLRGMVFPLGPFLCLAFLLIYFY